MNTKEAIEAFIEFMDVLLDEETISKEDMEMILKEFFNDVNVSNEDVETFLKLYFGNENMSKKEIKILFEAAKPKMIEKAELFDLSRQ